MSKPNPCDIVNISEPSVLAQCRVGRSDFAEEMNRFVSVRHEIGQLRLQKGSEEKIKELEQELKRYQALLGGKLEKQQQRCDDGDMRSCGYVYSYERFVKYFGPVDVWKTPKTEPTEIPMKPVHLFIVIPAGDQGTSDEMVFDTGAGAPGFSKRYIEQHPANFTQIGKVAFYNIPVYKVSGLNILFGRFNYEPAFAVSSGLFDYFEGSDVNHSLIAISGLDILQNIGFKVDFDRSRFTLAPDTDASLKKGKWSAVPVEVVLNDNSFSIGTPIEVNGVFTGVWLLDTGYNGFRTTKQCASKMTLLKIEGSSVSYNVSGQATNRNATVNVKIGDNVVDKVLMWIPGDNSPNAVVANSLSFCGEVGMEVLDHFNLIFDQGTFTLYMQPRLKMPMERHPLGINPKRVDGKIVVELVTEGRAGDKAGLKAEDVIEDIDGVDTQNISILEFMELDYSEKDALVFNVNRNGEKISIKVTPSP